MLHDGMNKLKFEQVLDPVTATSTQTSSAISTADCGALTVVFLFGDHTDTLGTSDKMTCSLQDSPNDSDYTDVGDSYIIGQDTNDIVIDADGEAGQCYRIGYIGSQPYVKGVITYAGTHGSGTIVSILAVKSRLNIEPAATPDS